MKRSLRRTLEEVKRQEELFKEGYRKVDPTTQRVISFTEMTENSLANQRAGEEKGFSAGYQAGKKKSAEFFFNDMAEVWDQVAIQASMAAKYASSIAGMYKAQVPKEDKEDGS